MFEVRKLKNLGVKKFRKIQEYAYIILKNRFENIEITLLYGVNFHLFNFKTLSANSVTYGR